MTDWFGVGFFNVDEYGSALKCLNGVTEDVPKVGMRFAYVAYVTLGLTMLHVRAGCISAD